MTGFSAHDDEVSIRAPEDHEEEGHLVLELEGTQSYDSGNYMNEKPATETVLISPETFHELVVDGERIMVDLEESYE